MSPGLPEKASTRAAASPSEAIVSVVAAGRVRAARSPENRLRLMLVDDHPVVRQGIGACLARQPRFEVVGEAGDGHEALLRIKELGPDIVLMDIEMPGLDGLEVTTRLRRDRPDVKVLILTMHVTPDYVRRILDSGARGCVSKMAPPKDLVAAIEAVDSGESFFSPEVARLALNQMVQNGADSSSELTGREREVLILIAGGLSNKEMAGQLGVGVRTIETHRERIMDKLNIHTIAGLTKYAVAKGLVGLQG